jgi:peptidoglycan/LPS O-acetylase OafA/YrhL
VAVAASRPHKLRILVIARCIIVVLIAALVGEVLFCRWLARRKWRPASTRITTAAGIASLVGPAGAVLPYTDYLPSFPFSLAIVWLLAAIGVIGIGIGVFAFSTGSKLAGTICVLTNIPVLAYWGFVGAFFSLGGSR